MNTILIGIYERGTANERVHFRALVDCNLSYLLILDTFYSGPNSITANQKACYWFSPNQVKAGDNIVLYTRAGQPSTETRPDGTVFRFLFRELSQPLYQNPNACAVLFEVNTWATTALAVAQ